MEEEGNSVDSVEKVSAVVEPTEIATEAKETAEENELKSPNSQSSDDFLGFEATEVMHLSELSDELVRKALKSVEVEMKPIPPPKEVKSVSTPEAPEHLRRSSRGRVENKRFSDAFYISPLCVRTSPKKAKPSESPVVHKPPVEVVVADQKPEKLEKPVKSEAEESAEDEEPLATLIKSSPGKRGRPRKCPPSPIKPIVLKIPKKELGETHVEVKTEPSQHRKRGRPKSVGSPESSAVEAKVSRKSTTDEKKKPTQSQLIRPKSPETLATAAVADELKTEVDHHLIVEKSAGETPSQPPVLQPSESETSVVVEETKLEEEVKEKKDITEGQVELAEAMPNVSYDRDEFPLIDCIAAVDPLTESDIRKWTGSNDHYEIPFSEDDAERSFKLKIVGGDGKVVATLKGSRTGLKKKGAKPKSVKFAEQKASKNTPTTSNGDSSTEMVRRLNVRKGFLEALLNRSKESDDLLLTDSEVKKVAVSMEGELHKKHGGTGTMYLEQSKLINRHLKNPLNKGLFQKLLTAELSPARLVTLTPEELNSKKFFLTHTKTPTVATSSWSAGKGPSAGRQFNGGGVDSILDQLMTDSTAQHRAHLFDLNCRICTKKEAEPVDVVPSKGVGTVSTPTGTKVSGYIQRGGVLDPVFTVAKPRMSDPLQLEESEPRRGDMASPSSSSSSAAVDGRPLPSDSLAEKWSKAKKPTQWKGKIIMPDMFKFFTETIPVTGPPVGPTELPPVINIVGRIDSTDVWKYLSSVKRAGVKVFSVIGFKEPLEEEDRSQYAGFFDNMVQKARYCVMQFPPTHTNNNIKDFYIMPLGAQDEIPPEMLPFDGPGIPENRKNMLLGLVVRHKLAPPTPTFKPKTSVNSHTATQPVVPVIPASPITVAPAATTPLVYSNSATSGLGEDQIRSLIGMVSTSPNPQAAFQHLLQCYGGAMNDMDRHFMLAELEKGGQPGSSQPHLNAVSSGAAMLPPDFAAMMAQMPQLLNPAIANGSPEFVALQQQFMGLMHMMMNTMMGASNPTSIQQPVAIASAAIPTPNTTTNDSDSSRESGKLKSRRHRKMSHTSSSESSSSSASSDESGEVSPAQHHSRRRVRQSDGHSQPSASDRRKRADDGHTWGSGSLSKKFDKKYEDADNLGPADSGRNQLQLADRQRPQVDYGELEEGEVLPYDPAATGGTT